MTKGPSVPAPTRKQLSRAERERRWTRGIWITTAIVAGLLVLILGYAWLDIAVLQPQQPVARVGEVNITTGEFQKAVKYRRYQLLSNLVQLESFRQLFGNDPQNSSFIDQQVQQIQFQLNDSNSLGREVLDGLIEDVLIRQEAARRNITVSPTELDAQVQSFFGYFPSGEPTPTVTPAEPPTYVAPTVNPTVVARWTPTATFTPTATLTNPVTLTPTPTVGPTETPGPTFTPEPTATPISTQEYAARVVSYTTDLRSQTDLTDADFRKFIEANLYREKLSAAFAAEAPNTEEQVHARHILIRFNETGAEPTEEEKAAAKAKTEEVLAKFNAGEAWDALASEFGSDGTKDIGGDLGWFPRTGRMVEPFAEAAFNAQVGTVVGPVETQFGFHLIQVLERGSRPLDASALQQKQQQAFQDWLNTQQAANDANGKPLVERFDIWFTRVPDTPRLQ
jgi:parvulin-like peptidyl-prolyl isomerase